MGRFLYKAKKGPKEVLEGSIFADSERAAIKKLIEGGFHLLWIKEASALSQEKMGRAPLFSKRIKAKDLANITRQLSELVDSGLPLFDALNIVERQITLPQLKGVIISLRNSIKDGNTFSQSLEAYPHVFSNLYINLVKSGEAGGMLNEVLANISDFLEKQEDTKSKVASALAYPALMAIVGLITIFILVGFVIPKLYNMFIEMGEILPLPTRMLIGVSNFIRTYWILLVIFVGGSVFFIKRSKSNRVTKKAIDGFKLKVPIIGALIKNTDMARFSRTLSTLLKNGVPILDSLKITSDVVDNEIIKEEVRHIHIDVKSGATLAFAIKKNPSFTPFLVNMVAVGEEGGFLDKMLMKVAKSYEMEIDRIIKIMSTLLEPIMILVMGLVVGFVVISMLLPVFQISLTAQ